jgi:chemotaxis family two-component system sensor kinase Cph1
MSKRIRFTLYFLFVLLLVFNTTNLVSLLCPKSVQIYLGVLETICIVLLIPPIIYLINVYTKKLKQVIITDNYSTKLYETLITQSYNPLFYQGKVFEGGKILTKQITEVLDAERCSIWLYNEDKSSIICQHLYIKEEESWYVGAELKRSDYEPYFSHLDIDHIIIANNAEKHEATSCFKETYLKPNNIKSMLDVPIIYKGNVIGVFCIEDSMLRTWLQSEINFSRLISSLYSFAFSIRDTNTAQGDLLDFENFVDNSVLVSKADKYGKITYVNKKFEEVSGWKLEEVMGKDHKIVNSGRHGKDFWGQMYDTIIVKKQIWNDIVTNRNKNGNLYWVDSYIKADFDEKGQLKGFRSIRYDVTGVIKQNIEIEKKNTYLEHAAKILRHDMHSGINTYIPRGVSSLERRLTPEQMEELNISAPFRMIKEGLIHAQKVYKGVYEFTNLVKKDSMLDVANCDLKEILEYYLSTTSYKHQVIIQKLGVWKVNQSLFCTAIDNLIRNGLKYNDSNNKLVTIKMEEDVLVVQDNGRGLTQEEFLQLSRPYTRKSGQKEKGTGLGLNICVAILQEHGFKVSCEKNEIGTKMKIKLT